LPVAELVRQSYALLGRHRDDLLRLGVVPVLIAFVIDASALGAMTDALSGAPDPALFLFLLGVVPMTLFAVNWLRTLLLGPAAAPGLGLRWGRRETRFLLLGVWISLLAGLAVIFPLGALFAFLGSSAALLPFALGAALLGYLYILLRLSLALTAVAIDETGGFSDSWAATQGVSGRFLLIVVLTALPFQLAALLLPVLLVAVGLHDAAPFASLLAGVVLRYLVSAAALAAIALAYRRLRGPRLRATT
jgi:hypothetical protein